MPVKHIVVCKTEEDVAPAKKLAEKQGGKITNTYKIFPGFDVDMPEDNISTFQGNPHIESVELDKTMHTQ